MTHRGLPKLTSTKHGLKRLSVFVAVASTALAGMVAFTSVSAVAASGASFTGVNEAVDGTGHCLHGSTNNCNAYDDKQFVWLNAGPASAALAPGAYYFTVIAPGNQPNPSDDQSLYNGVDAYTNRTFTVDGSGGFSYSGTHDSTSTSIRLAPYLDTTNNGGVYVMAICSLSGGYPATASACKFDVFKVRTDTVAPAAEPTVTKDAAGTYDTTYTWGITKDVDRTAANISPNGSAEFNYTVNVTHDAGTDSHVTVTGTIDVTNPNFDASFNIVPMTLTGVTDQLSDATVCTVDTSAGLTLTTFDTFYPYSCDLSSLPQGELDNTVTATWDDQQLSNGTNLGAGSAPFTFTTIGFTQTKIDSSVTVTDSVLGTLGTVTSDDASPVTFGYKVTFSGTAGTCVSHNNTATFTAGSGATGSASQSVSVCEGADLTVAKTAVPTFTRNYGWSVGKAVDKTLVKQVGGSTTFNYTVTAAETGFTDSAWSVTGLITVTNPNDWEAVTVTITDAINNGGVCVVTNGTGVSIPAGGSVSRGYTCSYAAAPNPANGTNTATATWDAAAAFTANGSASKSVAANFTAPSSTVNRTVNVIDSYAGALGSVTATDTAPFASVAFHYARTIAIPATGCLSYDNTATIVQTGQTAKKTVTVCGPAQNTALTIGFWQNKNGQAIITGQAKTGTCASATWLRNYAPFQDLAATSTCSAVANYVANVIKLAVCTSTTNTCNSMLKAQLLATALDVYFSDPALGGNKIGAPVPLGGVAIDLTQICVGGSGACNGTENVSAAFGGSTSKTVSQMLAYAASQSTVGGVSWYGQNKATQVLAKDAFDAINNGVAFGP